MCTYFHACKIFVLSYLVRQLVAFSTISALLIHLIQNTSMFFHDCKVSWCVYLIQTSTTIQGVGALKVS